MKLFQAVSVISVLFQFYFEMFDGFNVYSCKFTFDHLQCFNRLNSHRRFSTANYTITKKLQTITPFKNNATIYTARRVYVSVLNCTVRALDQ